MPEKDQVLKETFKYTGVFNFRDFYDYASEWLKEEEYLLTEEKYNEKISSGQKEVEILWDAHRRVSDYFKKNLRIKITIRRMVDVEVEIDGKKKPTNKGEIKMEVKGIIIKDPDSRWDSSTTMRFLKDTYNKYVIPNRIDAMEDKVIDDAKDFREEMKAFLEFSSKV